MPGKVPMKGCPDFSMLSDEKVREYRDFINSMLCCYSEFPEKCAVLREIWNDLKDESADRIADMPEKEPEKKLEKKLSAVRKTLLRNRKLRT